MAHGAGYNNVDAISDRLMYRLQYRNFGDYQTLVTNHTVDAGSDHAGVRWYELRDSGSGWNIHQQGTYAPDNKHRWMASAAMNGAGDLGLGFSVSSNSTSPSIGVTGRLNTDIDKLGIMTQGEELIVSGSGYQTHRSGRWGDYSMLAVDSVGANVDSYSDTGLSPNTTYWYRVNAENLAGISAWSNTASATTSQVNGGPTAVDVGSVVVTTVNIGKGTKQGRATVVVVDNLGAPVEGATVTGDFTGTFNESNVLGAVTDGTGTTVIDTQGSAKGSVSVTFCATNITHPTLAGWAGNVCDSN